MSVGTMLGSRLSLSTSSPHSDENCLDFDTDFALSQPESPNLETQSDQLKSLYQELTEKEHALIMAAQFGKNLIDEKEELEKLLEQTKREQQCQIESLEQESYELKRLVESMRNEYEAKICELNEDLLFLSRKLAQSENAAAAASDEHRQRHMQPVQHQLELLCQELSEKNRKLDDELKAYDLKLVLEQENRFQLEAKLSEKERQQAENSKYLANYQKELTKLKGKQQETEYALVQSCSERDKQVKLIQELTNKYIYLENEKAEMEQMIFQNENEIFDMRRANQELKYKLENTTSSKSYKKNKRRTTSDSLSSETVSCSPKATTNASIAKNEIDNGRNNLRRRNTGTGFSFNKCSNLDNSSCEFDEDEDTDTVECFRINETEEEDDHPEPFSLSHHHYEEDDEDPDQNDRNDDDDIDVSISPVLPKSLYASEFAGDCMGECANWQQETTEISQNDDTKDLEQLKSDRSSSSITLDAAQQSTEQYSHHPD